MRRVFLLLALSFAPCWAQQIIAPTPEQAGPRNGDTWGDYNVVNSFETGYRFAEIGGNQASYRSQENFGNGIRLLGSYVTVNSKDGKGPLFDEFIFTTLGLGGDPYESAKVRLQKNRIYEYNLMWRSNTYFNPGLVTDGGQSAHLLDTTFHSQDHDLTLFPQSKIKFFLGYSRDAQGGAGLSTVQLFDTTSDALPLFTNVNRVRNEYRIGNELNFFGFRFNWTRGWEDFKDDSNYSQTQTISPAQPGSAAALSSFDRSEPYHGTSPYWRVALFRDTSIFHLNGRFTYTSGNRDFLLNEFAIGTDRVGAAANQQIATFGNARRPVATGNLTVSVSPFRSVTITNQTSVYNLRTEGDSTFLQFNNATQAADVLYFQSLGIRTVANSTQVLGQIRPWLNIHGGYEYSNRRIDTVQEFTTTASTRLPVSQTNELNTGNLGFQIRPWKPLLIGVEGELGHTNIPFTPKSLKNYSALTGSVRYRHKSLQLSASTHTDYNANSVTLSAYDSHSRTYSGSASWAPFSWLGFDASYSKIHLDTIGGIAYFESAQFVGTDRSYYVSNIHSGTIGVRSTVAKRLDLYVGYSHVQDVGDGRGSPLVSPVLSPVPAFEAAQTFPIRFLSPMARVSLRLSERFRWNAGYQYYGYREDFYRMDNYLANTGYTSLTWSF